MVLHQQLCAIYAGTASLRDRRAYAEKVIDSFRTARSPEVTKLGRTVRAWRSQVLANFDTDGLSNGGTEAVNMLIEEARRLAHGYRNFDSYRLRMLLARQRHTLPPLQDKDDVTTLKSEEPNCPRTRSTDHVFSDMHDGKRLVPATGHGLDVIAPARVWSPAPTAGWPRTSWRLASHCACTAARMPYPISQDSAVRGTASMERTPVAWTKWSRRP